MKPNYDAEFGLDVSDVENQDPTSKLTKRDDVGCGAFAPARVTDIKASIKYLRGDSGTPQGDTGPGSCGRVSSS
jgi:hypothetical protein